VKNEATNKLLVEQIDVGEAAPRQIVSGLFPHYTPDAMKGLDVLVICNLKRAKLGGVESQGMVLAASNADRSKVELIHPPASSKIGERVSLIGESMASHVPEPVVDAKRERNAFADIKHDLKTNADRVATWAGKAIVTANGPCKANTLNDAQIS